MLTQPNHTKALSIFSTLSFPALPPLSASPASLRDMQWPMFRASRTENMTFALCLQEAPSTEHPQFLVRMPLWFITYGVSVESESGSAVVGVSLGPGPGFGLWLGARVVLVESGVSLCARWGLSNRGNSSWVLPWHRLWPHICPC